MSNRWVDPMTEADGRRVLLTERASLFRGLLTTTLSVASSRAHLSIANSFSVSCWSPKDWPMILCSIWVSFFTALLRPRRQKVATVDNFSNEHSNYGSEGSKSFNLPGLSFLPFFIQSIFDCVRPIYTTSRHKKSGELYVIITP